MFYIKDCNPPLKDYIIENIDIGFLFHERFVDCGVKLKCMIPKLLLGE